MSDDRMVKEQARAIITIACRMLDNARKGTPDFCRDSFYHGDDCYVLLQDATRLFCQAAGNCRTEVSESRWSLALPRFLFEHPEKCDEILALVESETVHWLSDREFSAA